MNRILYNFVQHELDLTYIRSPESITNENPYSTVPYSLNNALPLSSNPVGSLTKLPSGDVRYEHQSSQWTSVLSNTGISLSHSNLMDDDIPGESGFPFMASTPTSLDGLIASLPSKHHCDYLKDTYFEVFSPVCV
jgi:hypothetical protein